MRAVLSNGIRPRLGQSQSILSHSTKTIIRETTVAPPRRRLTFCDAFTILLAPVFTAAFVIDITRKDKRRQEWGQKIAAIERDIEVLREKELQSWQRLQVRSVQRGLTQQCRHYSTSRVLVEEQTQEQDDNFSENDSVEHLPTIQYTGERLAQLAKLRKYEHLIAVKLGLQLLLHISTGRSDGARYDLGEFAEEMVVPNDMDSLLTRLRRVNRHIAAQSRLVANLPSDLNLNTPERQQLDLQVSKIAWDCRIGLLSIPDLIYQFTKLVLESRSGLSLEAYRNLVSTFSTLDADALTFIAMYPYFRTKQVLTDNIVYNIIQQYGKIKDGSRLDRFTMQLTRPNSDIKITVPWTLVNVGAVRVPAPVNRHPRILDILIRSALQGDQPHKADAWCCLLIARGASTPRLASVFNNFLTYCAKHLNWAKGQMWMLRTVTFAAYFAEASPHMLQKLIFRILDLCINCHKTDSYEYVIKAAVAAGLDAPLIDDTRPDKFAQQARDIRRDWTKRLTARQTETRGLQERNKAARIFQTELMKSYSGIRDYIGVCELKELKRLMGRQRASVQTIDSFETSSANDNLWESADVIQTPAEVLGWTPFVANSNEADDQCSSISNDQSNPAEMKRDSDRDLSMLSDADGKITSTTKSHIALESMTERSQGYQQYRAEAVPHAMTGQSSISSFTFSRDPLEDQNLQMAIQDMLDLSKRQIEQYSKLEDEVKELKVKNSELAAKNSTLRSEMEVLKNANGDLHASYELLEEKRNRLNIELHQLKAKPTELASYEEANSRLNHELRNLNSRFSTLLVERDAFQEQLSMSQANYEQIAKKSTGESLLLRQDCQNLRDRLKTDKLEFEKQLHASRSREGNLRNILGTREQTIDALRLEIANLRTVDRRSAISSEHSAQQSFKGKGGGFRGSRAQEPSFALRFSRTGPKDRNLFGSDNDLSWSSS